MDRIAPGEFNRNSISTPSSVGTQDGYMVKGGKVLSPGCRRQATHDGRLTCLSLAESTGNAEAAPACRPGAQVPQLEKLTQELLCPGREVSDDDRARVRETRFPPQGCPALPACHVTSLAGASSKTRRGSPF